MPTCRKRGIVVLSEPLEPTALGVSRDEALWAGHGLRAYDLAVTWSPLWRIGSDRTGLPGPQRAVCEAADGQVDLHLLGEPGTKLMAGATELVLTPAGRKCFNLRLRIAARSR